MTTTLKELRNEITQLPWPEKYDDDSAPDFEHYTNWQWARHSANVIEQLVEALRRARDEDHCTPDTDKILDAALARAETVNL